MLIIQIVTNKSINYTYSDFYSIISIFLMLIEKHYNPSFSMIVSRVLLSCKRFILSI